MSTTTLGFLAMFVVLFAWAVVATAACWAQGQKANVVLDAHNREVEGINKVGKWYQDRVRELEEESQLLAAQLVGSGVVPIKNAMPVERYAEEEWAFDATGLVRERLDPRDMPAAL